MRPFDPEVAAAHRFIDARLSRDTVLTPDTSPDAIASAQLSDIAIVVQPILRAWQAHCFRPTDAQLAECVSQATDLPTWTCLRRLSELGSVSPVSALPTVDQKKRIGDARVRKVVRFLSKFDRYATLAEIVTGTKLTRAEVRSVLAWEPSPCKRIAVPSVSFRGGGYAYQLKAFAGAATVG